MNNYGYLLQTLNDVNKKNNHNNFFVSINEDIVIYKNVILLKIVMIILKIEQIETSNQPKNTSKEILRVTASEIK